MDYKFDLTKTKKCALENYFRKYLSNDNLPSENGYYFLDKNGSFISYELFEFYFLDEDGEGGTKLLNRSIILDKINVYDDIIEQLKQMGFDNFLFYNGDFSYLFIAQLVDVDFIKPKYIIDLETEKVNKIEFEFNFEYFLKNNDLGLFIKIPFVKDKGDNDEVRTFYDSYFELYEVNFKEHIFHTKSIIWESFSDKKIYNSNSWKDCNPLDLYSICNFGIYKDKGVDVQEILETNPEYLEWLLLNIPNFLLDPIIVFKNLSVFSEKFNLLNCIKYNQYINWTRYTTIDMDIDKELHSPFLLFDIENIGKEEIDELDENNPDFYISNY